jgi:hypothetical protein
MTTQDGPCVAHARVVSHYNDGMLALRYAAVVAIAVWTGGLIALGGVGAPAIFDVTGMRQVEGGRLLAGAIFGEILRRFHLVSYVCGGLVVASLAARAVLGPRPRRFAVRLIIAVAMLGAAAYSGLVVSPRIASLQQAIQVSPSSLPEGDARRIEFGRLHATSTGIQLVPLLGGLLLIFWELRD